jgi:hypothetical protein
MVEAAGGGGAGSIGRALTRWRWRASTLSR